MRQTQFLVSHEVPVDFLYESREFNDYDYALPHLLDTNEEYREYFLDSKKEGRYIIMDNSLHELGESYDDKRLIYWINKLEPNEFIVPDVWEKRTPTLDNAKKWKQIQKEEVISPFSKLLAVAQGETYSDIMTCASALVNYWGYEKIALSYGASSYNAIFPHPNPYIGKMLGRVLVVSKLAQEKYMKESKLHLLGCALPQEFSYYNDAIFNFIESIDTSNPVIHGIMGVSYKNYGLDRKISTKVDTIQETHNKEIVYNNIKKFKEILGHYS
jgi:hypothetical protein